MAQPPPPDPELDLDPLVADPLRPEADGTVDDAPASDSVLDPTAVVPEPRVPAKKDTTLREFMSKMDDYAPIVRCCSRHSLMILS